MARVRRQFSEEEISAAYDEGQLFDMIFDEFRGAEASIIAGNAATCARLHNDGRIDILSLLEGPAFEALPGWRFFSGHDFFEALISHLDIDVPRMSAFVDRLVTQGGADLAAGWPKSAFEKWCAAEPARPEWVLQAARDGDQTAVRVLDAALYAEGRTQTALAFLNGGPKETRPIAIYTLGRLKHSAAEALDLLVALDRDFDPPASDMFQAQRLDVAVKLARVAGADADGRLEAIVRRCLADAEPLTLNSAARVLWLNHADLSDDLADILLGALSKLDPTYGGVIDNLDHALGILLKGQLAEKAVEFVECYVARHVIALERFGSFVRNLLSGQPERRNQVFVRWMTGNVQRLAQGLADALRGREMAGEPISLNLAEVNLTSGQAVRLCKRAVGYFFVQPVTAASILVAVLRNGPPEAVKAARDLLFDPLLINYGGNTRDYLLTIAPDDEAHTAIAEALAEADAYVAALRSVGHIKELRPPELHLIIAQRLHQEEMRKVRKEADAQSVFKDIFTSSLVLHGKKVRSWHVGPDGKRQAFEVVMQTHGFSVELPRTEIVDPVDLDYRLRVLQFESEEDAA